MWLSSSISSSVASCAVSLPYAIGVEEINALEHMVVGHAQHFDMFGFQARFHGFEVGNRVDPEGDVVYPAGVLGEGNAATSSPRSKKAMKEPSRRRKKKCV